MPFPILTLTMNPALDDSALAALVYADHKIRTTDDRIEPGGGGINAAAMIGALGGRAIALLLAGGVTGLYLEELLTERSQPWQSVRIAGRTRLATTIHDIGGQCEYRFVPEGPLVSPAEWLAVLDLLRNQEWRWLIASGSLPRGVPADFYRQLAEIAYARGACLALDSSGPPLREALGPGVTLIKPSLSELRFLSGGAVDTRQQQAQAARALVLSGQAEAVAVSLGAEGALLAQRDGVLFVPAPIVDVRSTVGAGDCFLGAMVLSLARGEPAESALRWGVAAGTATVAQPGTAAPDQAACQAQFKRTAPRPLPVM